jgi:hypothetical protein
MVASAKLNPVRLDGEMDNAPGLALAADVIDASDEFTQRKRLLAAFVFHGTRIGLKTARGYGVFSPSVFLVKSKASPAPPGFGTPAWSRISRNLFASADGVNGFCRSATPLSSTP